MSTPKLNPGKIYEKEPIAVIGLGSLFPDASNTEEFWNNIINKRNSIIEVPINRWDPKLYYSADKSIPDKTYSKIGGFVKEFTFNPIDFRIPPKVLTQIDAVQQFALLSAKEALEDANYKSDSFPNENTAIIIGNSMGGDKKTEIDLRVFYPLTAEAVKSTDQFKKLSKKDQQQMLVQVEEEYKREMEIINEDSMPGELSNVIAGRVAATFNLRGKSVTSDAACASSLAAIDEGYKGLLAHEFDACVVGGSDRSLLPNTYVKFSKIGALSDDGSFPFDARANGFVQGEGAGMLVLKRLSDAKRDGDKIYALIVGVGASSDGKGKGITAPNPIGQELAVKRAYENAGLKPSDVQLIEAHGTSTKVGDRVEVNTLNKLFGEYNLPKGSIKLGSIKSQIGHLKSASGAAGMIKVILGLHHKILPPSINFETPNPNIKWDEGPLEVITDPLEWNTNGTPRRAGVSSFGFGGTNYHVVFEEYNEEREYFRPRKVVRQLSHGEYVERNSQLMNESVLLSSDSAIDLLAKLDTLDEKLDTNTFLESASLPHIVDLISEISFYPEDKIRLGLTYKSLDELGSVVKLAKGALEDSKKRSMAQARGLFVSEGMPSGKIAFVFSGQGSQYADMLLDLKSKFAVVSETFDEADEILQEFLDKKLSSYIFTDGSDSKDIEEGLRQTEITQPAMLTADIALYRLLTKFGISPDMVAGHSLGEYAALVAAGVLSFADALMAVAIRGRAMSTVDAEDKGTMAAISGTYKQIEKVLKTVKGYCVAANKNSKSSTVISGSTPGVEEAIKAFEKKGMKAIRLSVSAAFHTTIVEPAGVPLAKFLDNISFNKASIPITSNVSGDFFPEQPEVIRELMKQQVGAAVEWTSQVLSMNEAGANIFFEVGPKRALSTFVSDILLDKNPLSLVTNHPKKGGIKTFNEVLAAGAALGLDIPQLDGYSDIFHPDFRWGHLAVEPSKPLVAAVRPDMVSADLYRSDFSAFMEQTLQYLDNEAGTLTKMGLNLDSIVVTGVGVGLPGINKEVFDERNFDMILKGENMIDRLPKSMLEAQLEKKVRRLIKKASGDAEFFTPSTYKDVINLAGQAGSFDLIKEFDVNPRIADTYDSATALAIGAGLLALRDAGIPLVRAYKKTSTGSFLPGDWELPVELQDDTGVIFASAFPGYNNLVTEIRKFNKKRYAEKSKNFLNNLYSEVSRKVDSELEKKYLLGKLDAELQLIDQEDEEYNFNRKLLLEVLSMGHSQFAQIIKARGPNTQVNGACASTTQAVGIANDWIRTGRCKRVIVISGDDVSTEDLFEWLGAGFLASGAAAIKDKVEEAALPFDKRRDGLIVGMGAAALVVETEEEAIRRGVTPIVEIMGTFYSNSSFHGTRLDVPHVSSELGKFMGKMKRQHGIDPEEIAKSMMFMSHETYTPRRGGSAAAEIRSLRDNFGKNANDIHITNTKGFTGHAMGAGIEDVVAIKAIERGILPPIANFKEADPDLGELRLSAGGNIPVNYALRLAAGFGSQIAFALYKKRSSGDRFTVNYDLWLQSIGGNKADLFLEGKSFRLRDRGAANMPASAVVSASTTRVKAITSTASATKTREVKAKPVAKVTIPTKKVSKPVKTAGDISKNELRDVLIDHIAESTGYPRETVSPELELEADLGVDSVKIAEIFGEIREKYGLEEDGSLEIATYPTIDKMAEYFSSKLISDEQPAIAETVSTSVSKSELTEVLIDHIAESTGYPRETVSPELELEADLGVDSVKIAEIFGEIREKYGLEEDGSLDLAQYPTIDKMAEYFSNRVGGSSTVETITKVEVIEDVEKESIPPIVSFDSLEDLTNQIIKAIADKTGYPIGALEPTLEFEADLGIDSIKVGEVFGDLNKNYGLEYEDDLRIADLPTIEKMAKYFSAQISGEPVPKKKVKKKVVTGSTKSISKDDLTNVLIESIADKTGYPTESIDPALELEADLGIDSVKVAEIFGDIRERFGLAEDGELNIAEYPTIDKMAEYFSSKTSSSIEEKLPVKEAVVKPVIKPAVKVVETSSKISDEISDRLNNFLADHTGYPVSMIEHYVSLTEDLGVDDLDNLYLEIEMEFFASQGSVEGNTVGEVLASLLTTQSAEAPQKVVKVKSQSSSERLFEMLAEITGMPVSMMSEYVSPTDLGMSTDDISALLKNVTQEFGVTIEASSVNILNDILDKLALSAITPVKPVQQASSQAKKITKKQVVKSKGSSTHRYVIRSNQSEIKKKEGFKGTGYIVARKTNEITDLAKELGLVNIPVLKNDAKIKKNATLALINPTTKSFPVDDLFETLKASVDKISKLVLVVKHKTPSIHAMSAHQGAIGGLFKALAQEFDNITAKILVVENLDQVKNEITQPAVEVFYQDDKRYEVALSEENLRETSWKLPEKSVLLASGGAQGITYEMVKSITSKGNTIILLGRTVIRDDAESMSVLTDEELENLKWALMDELKEAGEKVTPVVLNKRWSKVTKSITVWKNIRELESMGASVIYEGVDISDETSVNDAFVRINRKLALRKISHFIHGAGVEISRPTKTKSLEEFQLVYNIKTQGMENLLQQMDLKSLKRVMAFSSVAGRFGNATQADYSAANEYLAKRCAELNAKGIRSTTVDWSAWAEVGMATRGSTMKILGALGVTTIPKDEGISRFVSEFALSEELEVVISGKLGGMAASATWFKPDFERGIMIDDLDTTSSSTIRTLSIEKDKYLEDHRIDDKAVLPGVMGMETMVQTVRAFTGRQAVAIHDVVFKSPVKLPRDNDLETISTMQSFGSFYKTELKSKFLGPDGKQLGDLRDHFAADIVPGKRIVGFSVITHMPMAKTLMTQKEIYEIFFHGPSYQVLKNLQYISESEIIAEFNKPIKTMFGKRANLEINPLNIEAAFQAAGLHLLLTKKTMGLPSAVGTIHLFKEDKPVRYIRSNYLRSNETHSLYDVQLLDEDGICVTHLTEYEMIHTGEVIVPKIKISRDGKIATARYLAGSLHSSIFSVDVESLKDVSEEFIDAFLTKAERTRYNGIKVVKKRKEWLGGRIAAKLSLAKDFRKPGYEIEIKKDENKSPYTLYEDKVYHVSISHSNGMAMAVTDQFTVDVERVSKKEGNFIKQMFSSKEQKDLKLQEKSDDQITMYWSMKEAHLKRMRIGLKTKIKKVEIKLEDEFSAIVTSPQGESVSKSILGDKWVVTVASPKDLS